MQVTIKHWPSLASNFIFFILGIAFCSYGNKIGIFESKSSYKKIELNKTPRGQFMISLSKHLLPVQGKQSLNQKNSIGLVQLSLSDSKPNCLLSSEIFESLSHGNQFSVKGYIKSLPLLCEELFTNDKSHKQNVFYPMSLISHLSFCEKEARVVYGSF